MKKLASLTLGILTAVGAFIDIGDLVTDALVGARYGLNLAWVTLLAVVGIAVYAEMAGRVAAVTGRPVFDLVRERLGPRIALVDLTASFGLTGLLLVAELAGVALAIELATSVSYLAWIPLVTVLVFVLVWRVPFTGMERTYGVLGLAMLVFVWAAVALGPDWGALLRDAATPNVPAGEPVPTYVFYAIALLGAQMTPYEVFFFSSGAVEHGWTAENFLEMRMNVLVGFPLGGLLALAIQVVAAVVFHPVGAEAESVAMTALPVSVALGRVGLALAIVGIVAATIGATLETLMSTGYTVAQYFGWPWGKFEKRDRASRFNLLLIVVLLAAAGVALTTIDPIRLTIFAVFLGAATLPFTYLPVLVVANDVRAMGEHRNGRLANSIGTFYLVLLTVVSLAAIPLLAITTAG
ncbi:MAG: divalent metal cation transporter [Actinobacteria bacterium]|nr:divalent metal cation transporter [Actinomycetota bacterium]